MTDLISRADAIAYIDRVIKSGLGRYKSLNYIRKYISALPSADAVEVIRCKDCKFKRLYDEGDTKYYYCALEDRPNRNWSVDDTDYCSWGEESEVEE